MGTRIRGELLDTSTGIRLWLDDACWAEVDALDRELAERLAGADGWSSTAQLHRGLGPGARGDLDALLELLRRHDLALDDSGRRPLGGLRLAVAGSGTLARLVCRSLLRAGLEHLSCLDPLPPDPVLWPTASHGTGAQALVRSLRPRHRTVLQAVEDVAELAGCGTDLVVVASPHVEAERWLLAELVRHDLPHLVVGCHSEVARIGPLVLPGRSPCVQCHDLSRSRSDPRWPQVLAQLCSRPANPDPTLAAHLASRVVLEVGWLARGRGWSRLQGTVETIDLASPDPRTAHFPGDPDCCC